MTITQYIQKIKEKDMTTKEKQNEITVSEVFHLWIHLNQRYIVIHLTDILENFTQDNDLKLILKTGKTILNKNINLLENEMVSYGIPLPLRPPKESRTVDKIEEISDRYVYRRILRGIQAFLPTHMMGFIHSTSPKIRSLFMTFLIDEMKLYDNFIEYGKLKEYLLQPPNYKS